MSSEDVSRPDGGVETGSAGEQAGERHAVLHAPALQFDPEDYRHFLEDGELTEAQATELLNALWAIMVGFVDLGFNISPVQSVLPVHEFKATLAADSAAVVSCKNSMSPHKTIAPRHSAREGIRRDS